MPGHTVTGLQSGRASQLSSKLSVSAAVRTGAAFPALLPLGTPAPRGGFYPHIHYRCSCHCTQCHWGISTPAWGNLPSSGVRNGLFRGAGSGARCCTLPLPEHPRYDTYCPVFCLLIIVPFIYVVGFLFFYERPKRVQLSVIPALWVVDPRGDVIAGISPTLSRGATEEIKRILLVSNR